MEFNTADFQKVAASNAWGDDEPPKEEKSKLLNGRYLKIKKLGAGSFNIVYLAEDLLPEGKRRVLSQKHLEMVGKLPEGMNPYRQNHYFEEENEKNKIDPEIKEELNNNEAILPENAIFEASEKEEKKSKKLVAIKKQKDVIDLNGLNFSLLREIKLLQELNHPNIVKLHDVFHLKNLLYFALEFGPVDLDDLIFKEKANIVLEPSHIKCIMKQILEGLGYLHSNWILHRDLKPSNMVIDSGGVLKIIDFNSAKIYGSPNREFSKQITTLWYRSPEQLFSSKFYGPPTDIWSVGCIFASLNIREVLFPGQGQIDQLQKIFSLRGTVTNDNWPEAMKLPDFMEFSVKNPQDMSKILPMMTKQGFDLLEKMLQLDPNKRPSAAEALQHPYFTQEDPNECVPGQLPISALIDK